MPTHTTESTGASITATWEFTTGTLLISPTATMNVGSLSEVASGAGVTIEGTLMKDSQIQIDASPDTDQTGEGLVLPGLTAGNAVAFGNLVYPKSDGKFYLTDADAGASMPARGMALGTAVIDATFDMITYGPVIDANWSFTVGGLIYAHTTEGSFTQTAPSASGDQVQVIGYALSSTAMFFNPNLVTVEIA